MRQEMLPARCERCGARVVLSGLRWFDPRNLDRPHHCQRPAMA